MSKTCPITVGIPTYRRLDKLRLSLEKILECDPQPDELIMHIDANDSITENWIQNNYPNIKIIKSIIQVGPGGGRNKIIAKAQNSIVASFDDDSYPLDKDYFARLETLFVQFPNVAVIGANIFHIGEDIKPDTLAAFWTADFVGCGCAYRREVFLETTGYVCLPLAYGMEETDLSLRLHAMGWKILTSDWLRVFHNTELKHHLDSRITAASISNQALLTYLRYPISLWGLGTVQCLNRIFWLVRHGRYRGILQGIASIPTLLWQNKQERQDLPYEAVLSYLHLRKQKLAVQLNKVTI